MEYRLMQIMKEHVYELIDVIPHQNGDAKKFNFVDIFIIVLIILNVLAVIVDTVQSIHLKFGDYFYVFEVFSVVVFTIEYILRVWSCTVNPKFQGPIVGSIRFMLTPLSIIDLLAFLPFYLP